MAELGSRYEGARDGVGFPRSRGVLEPLRGREKGRDKAGERGEVEWCRMNFTWAVGERARPVCVIL